MSLIGLKSLSDIDRFDDPPVRVLLLAILLETLLRSIIPDGGGLSLDQLIEANRDELPSFTAVDDARQVRNRIAHQDGHPTPAPARIREAELVFKRAIRQIADRCPSDLRAAALGVSPKVVPLRPPVDKTKAADEPPRFVPPAPTRPTDLFSTPSYHQPSSPAPAVHQTPPRFVPPSPPRTQRRNVASLWFLGAFLFTIFGVASYYYSNRGKHDSSLPNSDTSQTHSLAPVQPNAPLQHQPCGSFPSPTYLPLNIKPDWSITAARSYGNGTWQQEPLLTVNGLTYQLFTPQHATNYLRQLQGAVVSPQYLDQLIADFTRLETDFYDCPQYPVTTRVLQTGDRKYEVTLLKTDEWFDTGIPVVVDQDATVYGVSGGPHLRWAANFADRESLPEAQGISGQIWKVFLYPRSPNPPPNFVDTIKVKLLDSVPLIHLYIEITEHVGFVPCQDTPWLYEISSCEAYASAQAEAFRKAKVLRDAISSSVVFAPVPDAPQTSVQTTPPPLVLPPEVFKPSVRMVPLNNPDWKYQWIIHIAKQPSWYDTGIPLIVGSIIDIKCVGGCRFAAQAVPWMDEMAKGLIDIRLFEHNDNYEPVTRTTEMSLRNTLKLQTYTDGQDSEFYIFWREVSCANEDQFHKEMHAKAREWFQQMVEKF